ncbi:hypothetical protein LJC59_03910 [Desulfovibrio sp. OttesenSCG-928-A18]|nr:hypothetical protein [Desulfovibrio sp. OttesenSCG-928-A18]
MSEEASPSETAGGETPSLAQSKALLARSRLLGRVSAVIFFIAALAVVDALQTLMRHEFNRIELIPGESVLVSGMLPSEVKSHEQIEFTIAGDECLRFVPRETYKGFWMGGHMWRAELSAGSDCPEGRSTITVVDIVQPPAQDGEKQNFDDRDRSILFGGQQNPALVFGVTVWADDAARRNADTSIFRRYTGFPAFGVAAFCVILAIIAGIANWLIFSRAEKALALHDMFFVHGIKELKGDERTGPGPAPVGYRASFARVGRPFVFGDPIVLYDSHGREAARGNIMEVDRFKAHALFPRDGIRPAYGWLAGRVQD